MKVELLLSRVEGRLWAARREDGSTVELGLEPDGEGPRLERIVKARVTDVVPGIRSAFLDVGSERGAYLHASDLTPPGEPAPEGPIEGHLREGRELLVQIVREERAAKGARVTCAITLPGRLLALSPRSSRRAVSRRIDDSGERARLARILEGLPGAGVGWVARTAAAGAQAPRLVAEAERLLGLWHEVRQRADRAAAPATVLAEPGLLIETLRDAPAAGVESIVVDDAGERQRAIDYLRDVDPELASRVRLHAGASPLFVEERIDAEVERALRPKVWLDSGGFLVIEETEALVAIDVNTGKYVGRGDVEQTVLRTNLEAARQIPRQLRMRGLGGIVVVDLIDMRQRSARDEVLAAFAEELRKDPAKTRLAGISELGLLQLTRRWSRPGLARRLTRPCGECRGAGRVRDVL